MKRQWIILLGVLLAVILGLIFWILEYQHISLVLWMLVLFAVLWYCATVAVSLRPLASRRKQTRTRVPAHASQSSSRPSLLGRQWKVSILIAFVLGAIGILLWASGLDSLSHVFWFLVVIALLWGCAQLSFLLRPSGRRGMHVHDLDDRPTSRSWGGRRTFLDQFLPGVTMKSGVYNEGNEEIWDGNQKLPPQNN